MSAMQFKVSPASPYEAKYDLLDRNMRWEVADLVRRRNLSLADANQAPVIPKRSFYTLVGKRILDIVFSLIALVVTFPLNVAGAVVTLFDVGRPLIFQQQRLGKNGDLFTLAKFRNMRDLFDQNGHPLPGKDRVTKLGKFARRTSLDELLNFWSVLVGDMSLIGPRPLVPEYLDRYSVRHRMRMAVKPGIECPTISGSFTLESYGEQFENDVWYVENVSFLVDLKLIMRLLALALNRRHSKRRAGASKGSFFGYHEDGAVMDSFNIPHWALDEVLRCHGLMEMN